MVDNPPFPPMIRGSVHSVRWSPSFGNRRNTFSTKLSLSSSWSLTSHPVSISFSTLPSRRNCRPGRRSYLPNVFSARSYCSSCFLNSQGAQDRPLHGPCSSRLMKAVAIRGGMSTSSPRLVRAFAAWSWGKDDNAIYLRYCMRARTRPACGAESNECIAR